MENLKSGRRISAANRARLEAALQHYKDASACIRQVLESDDPTEADMRALLKAGGIGATWH